MGEMLILGRLSARFSALSSPDKLPHARPTITLKSSHHSPYWWNRVNDTQLPTPEMLMMIKICKHHSALPPRPHEGFTQDRGERKRGQ